MLTNEQILQINRVSMLSSAKQKYLVEHKFGIEACYVWFFTKYKKDGEREKYDLIRETCIWRELSDNEKIMIAEYCGDKTAKSLKLLA